jgi:hypothetical protein
VGGDRLEQSALKQLAARHHQVGGVAAERREASHGPRPALRRLAQAANELAGQVLRRG